MQRSLFVCAFASVTVAVGSLASPARGDLINYGDYQADTVLFRDVTESSDSDPVPLFGAPAVSSDSLTFNNMTFSAAAAGTGGADATIGFLTTTIDAVDGSAIHAMSFRESGSYSLSGLVNDAFASVSAAFIINVLEIDGVAVDPIGIDTLMSYTPSDGTYSIGEDGAGTGLWEGNLDVDLDAILGSRGIFGSATRLALTLTNTLNTLSMTDTAASISKKSLTISVVPAPPTAFLLLLGATGVRRRRRACSV